MLSLPPAVRIFVARGATDLRKSFDALAAVVREKLKADPLSAHVFIFLNRKRDRIKVLYWDRAGFCLFYKRLEQGNFAAPDCDELSSRTLMLLLEGLDKKTVRPRRGYTRAKSAVSQH